MVKNNLKIALFCCVIGASACKEERAQIGRTAPPLAVFDVKGKQIHLADFNDKPILINFWSQNCGVCIVELRKFASLQKQYPNALRILAINIDGESNKLKQFVRKENYPFSVGIDQLKITGERYQLVGTPTTYYVDKNGKIRAKFESILADEVLKKLFTDKE